MPKNGDGMRGSPRYARHRSIPDLHPLHRSGMIRLGMSEPPATRPPHAALVPPGGMELFARDMTGTFAADVILEDIQQKLSALDQWLPIDGDPRRPVGELVQQNSTGPLRLGYGAWRDLLLGCQFRNGGGE